MKSISIEDMIDGMYIQSTFSMDCIYQVKIIKQKYTSQIITSCRPSHTIDEKGELTEITYRYKSDKGWTDVLRGMWCTTPLTTRMNRHLKLKQLGI